MKAKKKRKIWIIWLIVAVLLAAAFLAGRSFLKNRQVSLLANISTVAASTGTIEKTVTGTGSLSAEETTENIAVLDGLQIDKVMVKTGDHIMAGDIMATFDAESLQAAIWDAQDELDSLDAQLNLLKDKTESVYIRTAVAGRVKQIFAAEGDQVRAAMLEHGALIMLSLDGKMKVVFAPVTTGSLAAGDKVVVTLSDGSDTDGTLQSVSAEHFVVTISDKTAPTGDPVTVVLEDGTSLGTGPLEISAPLAVTATDGTVSSILCDLNDKVGSGARLIELNDAPVSQAYIELYAKRQDRAARLATLMGYAQGNALTATSSGEIISVAMMDGQTTGSVSAAGSASSTGSVSAAGSASSAGSAVPGSSTALTVRTASNIQLTVNIDELDIAILAPGQEAVITLDALASLRLTGKIIEMAETAKASQGGATFAVTIEVPDEAGIRLGMSATAVITVERRENIVRIPLEALQEMGDEQFVYVGTAVSVDNLGEKRVVKTGISDGEYVEIISGLTAGEKINYYFAAGNDTMFPFQGVRRTGNTGNTSSTAD